MSKSIQDMTDVDIANLLRTGAATGQEIADALGVTYHEARNRAIAGGYQIKFQISAKRQEQFAREVDDLISWGWTKMGISSAVGGAENLIHNSFGKNRRASSLTASKVTQLHRSEKAKMRERQSLPELDAIPQRKVEKSNPVTVELRTNNNSLGYIKGTVSLLLQKLDTDMAGCDPLYRPGFEEIRNRLAEIVEMIP